MIVQRVSDPQALIALWEAAAQVIEPATFCAPASGSGQPSLDGLLDASDKLRVYVCLEADESYAAYTQVATWGEVRWLVIMGESNMRQEVVAALMKEARLDLKQKKVFGEVENAAVRELFNQVGATVSGKLVTWAG